MDVACIDLETRLISLRLAEDHNIHFKTVPHSSNGQIHGADQRADSIHSCDVRSSMNGLHSEGSGDGVGQGECELRREDSFPLYDQFQTGVQVANAHIHEGGKTQICFDFTKGLCTRGDKCKYSHDLATIVNFNSKEKGICFDYLRNQCHRGLLCRFSHDLSNIAQQCQVYNGTNTRGKTNAICYDFVKGVCQRGNDCRYSHDLSLIARTARGTTAAKSGEICYDYLRGRCNRGANCKYSHNITFLTSPAFLTAAFAAGAAGALNGALSNVASAAAVAAVANRAAVCGVPPLGPTQSVTNLPSELSAAAVVAAGLPGFPQRLSLDGRLDARNFGVGNTLQVRGSNIGAATSSLAAANLECGQDRVGMHADNDACRGQPDQPPLWAMAPSDAKVSTSPVLNTILENGYSFNGQGVDVSMSAYHRPAKVEGSSEMHSGFAPAQRATAASLATQHMNGAVPQSHITAAQLAQVQLANMSVPGMAGTAPDTPYPALNTLARTLSAPLPSNGKMHDSLGALLKAVRQSGVHLDIADSSGGPQGMNGDFRQQVESMYIGCANACDGFWF